MSASFEKVTLWVSFETYGSPGSSGICALDFILPALDQLDPECKILDCDSEDYKLVKVRKARGGRDGDRSSG